MSGFLPCRNFAMDRRSGGRRDCLIVRFWIGGGQLYAVVSSVRGSRGAVPVIKLYGSLLDSSWILRLLTAFQRRNNSR